MHATKHPRGSRPADDGLQFLPLLRRPVRGVSGDGNAPRVLRRRPQLSRQSLPWLRRLLHRLPVLAAARIQRQCAARCSPIARAESYAAYAWPRACSGLFARNGLAISLIAALSVAAFIFGFAAVQRSRRFCSASIPAPARSMRLMPHNAMALLFGAAFLYAIVAMAMGVRAFWRDIGEPVGMLADPALALAGDARMPASCAISTAAASAASTKTNGRPTAASSITI